ncbi:MAG: hypothetical protein AB7R89_24025 [Dehalococcoidia bacterium]
MATPTEQQQRALSYLRSLELMVDDLPEIADEWDELSDGECESWSHDWDNEMAKLTFLGEYVAQGVLADDDERRYSEVVQKLRDAAPLIRQTHLRSPQISSTP